MSSRDSNRLPAFVCWILTTLTAACVSTALLFVGWGAGNMLDIGGGRTAGQIQIPYSSVALAAFGVIFGTVIAPWLLVRALRRPVSIWRPVLGFAAGAAACVLYTLTVGEVFTGLLSLPLAVGLFTSPPVDTQP